MSSVLADLQLPATPAMPRTLSLMLGLLTGHLTALIVVDHNVILSAQGTGELTESVAHAQVLRIGSARFPLLPEEVEQVRDLLAKFPSPALPSHGAAHEATSAADLPSDGGCGTAPPVQGNAGGSLDSPEVLA